MSRNIEDVFGGVAVSTRQTPELYTAVGGETVITAQKDFVGATLILDGSTQTPGEAYTIDGRNFNLAQPLNPGTKVQLLLNTAWSPKEVQGQYTQVVQFRSTGGETNYAPAFSFSSVLMFVGDRPWVPGIDYTTPNGKIVYASPLVADKQVYIIFNGAKGDLASYKKLDDANADKSELLQRILDVYPVNWPVDSEAAMLALDAKPSDTATRSDQNRVYYLTVNPASDFNNWKPFIELTNTVASVNGRVGDVIVAEKGANSDITSLNALSGPLRLGGDAVNQYDAVTLKQLMAAGGGTGANMTGVMTNFLGAVEWFLGTRAKLPAGHLASDGQLLNRADYADIWNAISSGILISTDDANWQATPTARGGYSTGDGSTTFRMPDLNGVWVHPTNSALNSIPGLFLRGDGNASNGNGAGVIRWNAAPNITGNFSISPDGANVALANNQSGAFFPNSTLIAVAQIPNGSGAANRTVVTGFDASRSNASYNRDATTEVRPNSVKGIWLIRVNSKFSAAGTSFDVITADSALPATGTVVYGGDVRSTYQVAGANNTVARMRAKNTIGGAKNIELSVAGGAGVVLIGEAGDMATAGDMTVGANLNMGGGTISRSGQVNFITAALARQTLLNMGVSGNVSRIIIPISQTQAHLIQSGTSVVTMNSSGETTFSFPVAFASANTFVCSNGDANVTGGGFVDSLDSWNMTNTGVNLRNRRLSGGGTVDSVASASYRVNWVATGLINL